MLVRITIICSVNDRKMLFANYMLCRSALVAGREGAIMEKSSIRACVILTIFEKVQNIEFSKFLDEKNFEIHFSAF